MRILDPLTFVIDPEHAVPESDIYLISVRNCPIPMLMSQSDKERAKKIQSTFNLYKNFNSRITKISTWPHKKP